MENHPILSKFTSRKFIAALFSLLTGVLIMAFGHAQEINVIMGALAVIVPSVVYCVVEGRLDAKKMKESLEAAAEAAEQLKLEQVGEIIRGTGAIADALGDDDEAEAEEDEGEK